MRRDTASRDPPNNQPRRCWWRHPGIVGQEVPEDQLVGDWRASLNGLASFIAVEGPFQGVLGFSQGAAAAFLLAMERVQDVGSFLVLVGGYLPGPLGPGGLLGPDGHVPSEQHLPTLHLMSAEDQAVPIEQSLALSDQFVDAEIHVHEQGHCVPQRAADIQAILGFMSRCMAAGPAPVPISPVPLPAEQCEELEALQAIFMEQFRPIQVEQVPARFEVSLAAPGGDAGKVQEVEAGSSAPSQRFRWE